MNKAKLIFIFLLLPLFAFTAHKFYISLIKVEYKPSKETIQVTMRIFIDDLQKVINETNNLEIELGVNNEVNNSNELISKYIDSNFTIKINDKILDYEYLGKEYKNDLVYLYLQLENIKAIHTIEITDTMLMDYFPAQKNIIKLIINDVKKTFLLTEKETSDIYSF